MASEAAAASPRPDGFGQETDREDEEDDEAEAVEADTEYLDGLLGLRGAHVGRDVGVLVTVKQTMWANGTLPVVEQAPLERRREHCAALGMRQHVGRGGGGAESRGTRASTLRLSVGSVGSLRSLGGSGGGGL